MHQKEQRSGQDPVELIGCTGDPGKGCFNVVVGTEVKPAMNRDTNERGGNKAFRETHSFKNS